MAEHWLLVRRCLDDPSVNWPTSWSGPHPTLRSPSWLPAIGARWHVEEDLEACKALGLGHYEGRSYLGWYRHITLVLLASAFLVDITVRHHLTASASPARKQGFPTQVHPLRTLTRRSLL